MQKLLAKVSRRGMIQNRNSHGGMTMTALPKRPYSQSQSVHAFASLDSASPSFEDDAEKIAEGLITIDDAYDLYFQHAARAVVAGLLIALKAEYGAAADITHLRPALRTTPHDLATFCAAIIHKFGARFPALSASLGEFTKYSPDDRELSAILGAALFHTVWLESDLCHSSQASTNLASFLNPDSTTRH
jgi:hypothetical protein